MSALTCFLDWLDESAAGVIRIAYLLAGVIAVASYFSDGNVPPQLTHLLDAILPWALAGALEIHTYLSARRVRRAYQDRCAAERGSAERERAMHAMRVNLSILAGLLAFSMYNQLQYLAQTWTPPHTPLTPPGPLAYLIRAIITPAAFMAAAFLAPMGEGLAAQVQTSARRLAAETFKVAMRQWKRRLREMEHTGHDVSGALVQLVDDAAERRMIETIHHALLLGEQASAHAHRAQAILLSAPGLHDPTRPPTGPGSPIAAPSSDGDVEGVRTPSPERPAVLRLTPERPPRKSAARARSGGTHTRGVRTVTVELQARAAWRPGMTVTQLERAAGISRSAAGKWRKVLAAESGSQRAL